MVNVSAASFDCWAIGLGILLTANQVLAILSFFPWQTNIRDFFAALGMVIGSTKSVSYDCIFTADPNLLYLPRCLIPFLSVIFTIMLYGLSRPVASVMGKPEMKWTVDKSINTLGQILLVFYIAIAAIIVVPLQCYEHPNEEKSLTQYPQILCWQSDHVPLLMMALVVAVFFVIPFTAWCVWGTFSIVNPNSGETNEHKLMQFRFMLFRFRPDCWWWNNACVVRQLLLAFTPSLPDDLPHVQAAYIVTVLVFYIAGHCSYWPFKLQIFNNLELVVCLLLIQVVIAGGTAVETSPTQDFLSVWVFTTVVIMYLIIVSYFAYCVYRLVAAKGGAPTLGNDAVNGCTDEEILALWQNTCKATIKLSGSQGQEALMGMNVYDKKTLLKAMGVWYAVRSDHFTYNDKFRRIGGLGSTKTNAAKVAAQAAASGKVLDSKDSEDAGKDVVAIAEEANTKPETMSSGLPAGWEQATDPLSGKTYFYNRSTGETSWTAPTTPNKEEAAAQSTPASGGLPAGWEQATDPSSGKFYFYNRSTGETSWAAPPTTT